MKGAFWEKKTELDGFVVLPLKYIGPLDKFIFCILIFSLK